MKISVSLPDELFESAARLAARMGTSRSGLCALALSELVARSITAQLNAVCGDQAEGLDPVLMELQALSIGRERW